MNKKNKKWIIALVVVIAVAVLLQMATYSQYRKLNTAVVNFNKLMQAAKTAQEQQAIYNLFLKESSPLIDLSQSHAAEAKQVQFKGSVNTGQNTMTGNTTNSWWNPKTWFGGGKGKESNTANGDCVIGFFQAGVKLSDAMAACGVN